ncbi:hypothetical protein KRMM14A1004_21680 [Krasilnikovia sp. MM14-A1004]
MSGGFRYARPVAAVLIGCTSCSTDKQHAAGEHTVAELAELSEVSRSSVYRVRERAAAAGATA